MKRVSCLHLFAETYSNNSVSVSHANQDLCYYTLRALLEQQISKDYVKVDTSRIYGSGQSAGSSATQTFVRQHPEFYAAAASTSFAVASEGVGEYIPTYLQTGQSDLGNLLPDLWGSATLQGWIEYLFKANGLDTDINSWTSAVRRRPLPRIHMGEPSGYSDGTVGTDADACSQLLPGRNVSAVELHEALQLHDRRERLCNCTLLQ